MRQKKMWRRAREVGSKEGVQKLLLYGVCSCDLIKSGNRDADWRGWEGMGWDEMEWDGLGWIGDKHNFDL